MKNENIYMIGEIHSFHDLQKEKLRLKSETRRVEERMNNNFSNIKQALSPQNILQSVIEEITSTAPWIGVVYSIGQKLFGRRKKKKKIIKVD